MEALEAVGLTKKYRNGRGIEEVSLCVGQGEVFGLLGPNGCGKTTTMKVIAGLVRADSGSVRIFGRDPLCCRDALLPLGCLIESPAFCDYITAEKNLAQAARYYPHVDKNRVREMLELTGLMPYRREKPRDFSLGMKQRLGLALSLLSAPRLVLLDEPVNGLDIEAMVAVREIVVRMAKVEGVSFLVSSHLAHELELMCHRIAVMKAGRLVANAGMDEVVHTAGTLEKYYLKNTGYGMEGAL